MEPNIRAVRGMNDILPDTTPYWHIIEAVLRKLVAAYCYQEIKLPILECTALFTRTIGEVTDIVEKEMYTFKDRNQESLTLRPEGTAGCVRALITNSLLRSLPLRLWYMGPMFRYERPQKGRYRSFWQFGLEAYGLPGPDIDAEIILFAKDLWQQLGISSEIRLEINSLGSMASRLAYKAKLLDYLNHYKADLDEDSLRRLTSNPLRILDSKNPTMQPLINQAPSLLDFLDDDASSHFDKLKVMLSDLDIPFTVNPRLVRGLDYYSNTVFEWVSDQHLGAQSTVCAGGRYNGLVEQLGGAPTQAIGFSIGLERLVILIESLKGDRPSESDPHVYMILVGERAQQHGLVLTRTLRQSLPTLRVLMHCGGGNFKKQFKRADKSRAALALIIGDDELRAQQVSMKWLRKEGEQETVANDKLVATLAAKLALDEPGYCE